MVEAVGQYLDLVARTDLDAMVERAGTEPLGAGLQASDRNRHAPGEHRARDRREQKTHGQERTCLQQ